MKPTQMAYEEMYSDLSGVEFSVKLKTSKDETTTIEFIGGAGEAVFPIEKLKWIIDALLCIKFELGSGALPK